jgi:hypothetical protein
MQFNEITMLYQELRPRRKSRIKWDYGVRFTCLYGGCKGGGIKPVVEFRAHFYFCKHEQIRRTFFKNR